MTNKAITLIELVTVLLILGLCYLGTSHLLKRFVKKQKTEVLTEDGDTMLLTMRPWGPEATEMPAQPNELGWSLLCDRVGYNQADQKLPKCKILGGTVMAKITHITQMGREWFLGFGPQTEIRVENPGKSYSFTSPVDKVTVGMWKNPLTGKTDIVFQLLTGKMPDTTHRFFVGQEEWKTETEIKYCRMGRGGDVYMKTGEQCVVGKVTDPSGNTFVLGYHYFEDWFARKVRRASLGNQPITLLTPLNGL